jgi:hypothetical protein
MSILTSPVQAEDKVEAVDLRPFLLTKYASR